MYETFGEFDSWEEINEAAKGQRDEGDEEALKKLAKENGIDIEDAEDYFDGVISELCSPLIAAIGKLKIEEKDLKPENIMEDWINYIRALCSEDETFCIAVRKKGKSLKGCIAALLSWSFNHQKSVDADIIKAANIKANRVTLGIPGMRTAHQLIKEYYLGGKA